MLVVKQGEVAVIKAYVGLPTEDTSGTAFKFGSIVRPGHRGIWQEPLRTGKYAINPRCYEAEKVPTAILSLNWSEAVSEAHKLDERLSQIVAKSREGFVFTIELVVQIHVPDTTAPRVISMVGTIANLVNEVLQAAVGNHFRDKLQSMPAVEFIETRQQVQQSGPGPHPRSTQQYEVETRGVYIQDVILPKELVKVLTQREIANQEKATFQMQQEAQKLRIDLEKTKGTADMQAQLAQASVGVEIATQTAAARKRQADGEATYIAETGRAKGAEIEAVGLASAKGFEAQVKALGQGPTAIINVATALAERGIKIVPEILAVGGSGTFDGVGATLMKYLNGPANDVPEAGSGRGGNGYGGPDEEVIESDMTTGHSPQPPNTWTWLPAIGALICAGEPDLRAEIAYQGEHEMAVFASDYWLRRTRLGLFTKIRTESMSAPWEPA